METDVDAREGMDVHLHGRLLAMLEDLAHWQRLSPVDALRKAITDAHFFQEQRRQGGHILVETRAKTFRVS